MNLLFFHRLVDDFRDAKPVRLVALYVENRRRPVGVEEHVASGFVVEF